ncbi:MAG: 16S rRNA (guanine(527)-N(7))-methyltransferase RsmG [Clostridia bacterium]|nr:16S rRNA (guanine(527)-N(7))-methyltransferase RsmG [Clostridia bacterium]
MLKDILGKMKIEIGEREERLFDLYYANLISWNEKFNLTAVTERNEVDVKHFADSLAALDLFPKDARLVDVGSGAGFPAIPLKIVRDDLDITMLDALNKRVTFLKDTLAVLELPGTALHLRAEEAAYTSMRESFDAATARAVAKIKILAQYLLPLLKVGGRAVLYKGGDVEAELKEAEGAIKALGGVVTKAERRDFEGFGRTIVVIDKVFSTPNCYPRRKIK